MSPEQAGGKDPGTNADVYALNTSVSSDPRPGAIASTIKGVFCDHAQTASLREATRSSFAVRKTGYIREFEGCSTSPREEE